MVRRSGSSLLFTLIAAGMAIGSRVAEGQTHADRILRRGDSAEAHLMMGTAFLLAARMEDSIREFDRALALNPKLAMANSLIGKMFATIPIGFQRVICARRDAYASLAACRTQGKSAAK